MLIDFIKMHGCGNDFIVIDARLKAIELTSKQIIQLADYKRSIGFDQLLLIENSKVADISMRIFNSDGSEASACGNGSRSVAKLILEKSHKNHITIATKNRILAAKLQGDLVAIDMGEAEIVEENIQFGELIPFYASSLMRTQSEIGGLMREKTPEIPGRAAAQLARDDALSVYSATRLAISGSLVEIGNPHVVIEDLDKLDISKYGPLIENDQRFPNKVNVNFVSVVSRDLVNLRTWERGVGATLACGSGACASFALLYSKGLINEQAVIQQAGGNLQISIENGHILMAGEAKISYRGTVEI